MKLLLTLAPGLDYAAHGDLVVLDWDSRSIIDTFRYEHRYYEETHKGFAGATWHDGRLFVSTEVELLELDPAPLRLRSHRSFDFLNDAHDIAVSDDRIWVCNSGLDTVEEFDLDWNHQRAHDLVRDFGRQPKYVARLMLQDLKRSWARLRGSYFYYSYLNKRASFRNLKKLVSPTIYRESGEDLRYTDFRPHYLHPNHAACVGDDVWVTLFSSGQIVSLKTKKVIAQDLGRPHDGTISGDRFYVTDCKNRRVIAYEFDPVTQTLGKRVVERVLPLESCDGFVRGLARIDGKLFVGLTAKRGTSESQQVARVARLCPDTLEPLDQWQVPTEYGNAIFSILDATPHYSPEN